MVPRFRFKPSRTRWVLAGGCLSFALSGVMVTYGCLAPRGLTMPGLKVGGATVPPFPAEASLRMWLVAQAAARVGRGVAVEVGQASADPGGAHATVTAPLSDFGVSYDVDAAVVQALAVGHRQRLADRLAEARAAGRGAVDVPLAARVNAETLRAKVAPLTLAANIPAVSARVGFDGRKAVPEREGRYVDVEGVLASIERLANAQDGPAVDEAPAPGPAAEAPVTHVTALLLGVPPRFTSAFVEGVDTHAVLASYETYFSRNGDQSRRGQNIDVAAAKLDGLVLPPGEMFSFNDNVGARSEENGFQKSWEILKGEMVEGVGGGTCQVASTLHAVAFFGGLEVLERLPHSRPSAYIPMGLDATVVYPEVDMKLRNPFAFPVVLHAAVDGNRLRVSLLGAKKPASVSFTRELVQRVPYRRKVEEDPNLHGNQVVMKQHGIRGFKIKRVRQLTFDDGLVEKEQTTDRYPSTTEIYKVPTGFDVSLLPPLPTDDDDDDGEGSDSSAATASAAASIASGAPPTSAAEAPAPSLLVIDGPGIHAPSEAQLRPPKKITMRR